MPCLDLSREDNCKRAVEGAREIYQLAADMGGMGFIERFRIECLRLRPHNTPHGRVGLQGRLRTLLLFLVGLRLTTPICRRIPRSGPSRSPTPTRPCPSAATAGKSSSRRCSARNTGPSGGLKTFIARFHNVYGPWGTWTGGREKAPAALCRKVIQAVDEGVKTIDIWGDGTQTRSYMYIDDCVKGIDRITHCDELIATAHQPGHQRAHLGRRPRLPRREDRRGQAGAPLPARRPRGVAGRNSDNTMIKMVLGWEPDTPLRVGMRKTYQWIKGQYERRKTGQNDGRLTGNTAAP